MNPVTLHVLDYTLDASGNLTSITIASPDELKSYVYNTSFSKVIDNTVFNENPTYGENQRTPNNGF